MSLIQKRRCQSNQDMSLILIRKMKRMLLEENKNIRNLYFAYHYNENVRKKGEERIRFKVDCKYAELIFQVQNNMIRKFVDEGIAIETNPSSNYLIGTIKKYDEHPIFRFNSRKFKTSGT